MADGVMKLCEAANSRASANKINFINNSNYQMTCSQLYPSPKHNGRPFYQLYLNLHKFFGQWFRKRNHYCMCMSIYTQYYVSSTFEYTTF